LRSNTVVRWEYLPGSTLFVVWQHNRGSYDTQGQFDLNDGLRDLQQLPSANTFLVKFSYWMSL
jgi:hypothetical protein